MSAPYNPNYNGNNDEEYGVRPLTPTEGKSKHWHQRSKTLRRIMSTVGVEESKRQLFRDETPAGAHAERHNPVKKLCFSTCFVILLLLAALTATNKNMIVIFVNIGSDSFGGGYAWNYGISPVTSNNFKDNTGDTVTGRDAETLSLVQTNKYHFDSSNITRVTIGISILLCFYVIFVVYIRNEFDLLLYLKCCGRIKVPQRGSIYEAYKLIKILCIVSVVGWLFLAIYGCAELSTRLNCTAGECTYIPYPHYGVVCLFFVQIVLLSCGDRWLTGMDVKFNEKNMKYYFPENVEIAKKNKTLDLHQILDMITACFNICILFFVIFWMQKSQLLNVIVTVEDSRGFAVVPFGWKIDKSIDSASSFQTWANLSFWAPTIMGVILINTFIIAMFLCYTVHKFSHLNNCVLYIIRIDSLLQLIIWSATVGIYYYLFSNYWIKDGKGKDEWVALTGLRQESGRFFAPDWGAIILLIVEYYLIKLVYKAFFRLGKVRYAKSEDSKHNLEMVMDSVR